MWCLSSSNGTLHVQSRDLTGFYTPFFFKDLGESVTLMHLRKVLMLQENMHSVCSRSLVAISLMASLLNHSISSFCIFF